MSQLVKQFFFRAGFNFQRVTPTAAVRSLIAKMAPVNTEVPLIRLGGDGDGGYLVPDDLNDIAACYSPGVYEVAQFEKDLVDRGIECYLADRTVDAPPIKSDKIHFLKKHIGVVDDASLITMETWLESTSDPGREAKDLLLQMDIERAEYCVLLSMPRKLLQRFRVLVVEFHDLHLMFDRRIYPIYEAVFRKLLKDFHLIHMHPNNFTPNVTRDGVAVPPLMEITFHRKDRAETTEFSRTFPHPLDRDNVPSKPSLPLPDCWLRSDPSAATSP
ncbi:MAG: hypothetical protein AAF958_07215 [Planctomycetota bacterium]